MNYNFSISNRRYYSNPKYSTLTPQTSNYFGKSINKRIELFSPLNSRNNKFERNQSNLTIISNYSNIKNDNLLSPNQNMNNYKKNTFCSEMINLKLKFNSINQKIERLNKLLNVYDITSRNNNNEIKRPNSYNQIYKKTTENNNLNLHNSVLFSNKKSNIFNSPISCINNNNYLSPSNKKSSVENYYSNDNLINSSSSKSTLDYNNHSSNYFTPNKSISLRFYSNSHNDNLNLSNNSHFKINSFSNLLSPEHNKNEISKQENFNIISETNKNNYDNIKKTRKLISNYKSRNSNNNKLLGGNSYRNNKIKKIDLDRLNNTNVLLSNGELKKAIKNLHEKRKILVDGYNDGLERYRKLKLNQQLNNFNKRIITGNWSYLRNSFDESNYPNFLNNSIRRNHLKVKVYYPFNKIEENSKDKNIKINNNVNKEIVTSEIKEKKLDNQKLNNKDEYIKIKDNNSFSKDIDKNIIDNNLNESIKKSNEINDDKELINSFNNKENSNENLQNNTQIKNENKINGNNEDFKNLKEENQNVNQENPEIKDKKEEIKNEKIKNNLNEENTEIKNNNINEENIENTIKEGDTKNQNGTNEEKKEFKKENINNYVPTNEKKIEEEEVEQIFDEIKKNDETKEQN